MKSKFIEALKKLSQSSVLPLGFGRRREGPKSPLLLIADLNFIPDEKVSELLSSVDALIFSGSKTNKDTLKQNMKSNDSPWGLMLKSVEDLKDLKEQNFDFLVFSFKDSGASLLRIEEQGKVMEIDVNLSDSQLRAMEFLPVDALLIPFPRGENSLRIQDLLAYQRIDLLVTKPLLGYVPAKISVEDLRLLWEAGLDGAIIKGKDLTREDLERLKVATKSFPSHRGEKKRAEALLPSLSSTIPGEPEEEPNNE